MNITDDEAAEVMWASSEQGEAAVRAAWEEAGRLDHCTRRSPASPPWSGTSTDQVSLDMADIGAIVYAAYLAAGWDGSQAGPAAHVHDWQVRSKQADTSVNPAGGSSIGLRTTVALMRCAACGDIKTEILRGHWDMDCLTG